MANLKNFAKGETLAGNTADATAITLKSGHGARFPATPFQAIWWNVSDYPDASDDPFVEIVQVTSISGDVLTVTRAQESTVASSKNAAGKRYFISATITAGVMAEFMSASPAGGTFRIKDGTHLQVWDNTDSAWRTMWLAGGQIVFGPADTSGSTTPGFSNAYRILNGVLQIYNQDTGKFHALFATGTAGSTQVTLGPQED